MRQANTAPAFSTVRFRATARRSSLSQRELFPFPSPAAAADFGILLHGCPVEPGPARTTVAGDTVTLTFPAPVIANGYYWKTAGLDPAADPVAWAVEALRERRQPAAPTASATSAEKDLDGGGREAGAGEAGSAGAWEAVGASAWRLDVHGRLHLYSERSYPTPAAPRGARLEACSPQMRPPPGPYCTKSLVQCVGGGRIRRSSTMSR